MKMCKKCGVSKPPESFYVDRRSKTGRSSACKQCIAKQDTPLRKKGRFLKYYYGLTEQQVHEMYVSQSGRCLICNVYKSTYSKPGGLVIDHNHSDGTVRGLLCTNCNTLLGRCNDNVELLQKAIFYLQLPRKKEGSDYSEPIPQLNYEN